MELCKFCGAVLLDDEIEYCCSGLCQDCCEEVYLDDEKVCTVYDCPFTACNAREDKDG